MNWFKSIFTTQKGSISSKRVCGVLGFLVCLFVLVWCTIKVIEAPNFADIILICCSGLLGVDAVMKPWVKKDKEEKEDKEEDA